MRIHFPNLLITLRTNAKLTNIQLAELAKVSKSIIPGLQSGKRQIGEFQARKIGAALGLTGNELQEFIYCAMNNAYDKVLAELNDYPAELINLLALQLKDAGIEPNQVVDCKVQGSDVLIILNDGKQAHIKTQLALAEG